MGHILEALAPIFLLIVIGYVLKHRNLAPDAFWASAEWMTFYLFFPALLLRNTAQAELSGVDVLSLAGAGVLGVLGVALIVRLLRDRLPVSGPGYTSVFQGSMRPNVYLGIAIALALYGSPGLAAISVCIAVLVPLVNVLAVLVLIRHTGTEQTANRWQALRPLIRHPLILACAAGGLLNVTATPLPPVIEPLLAILGKAALPVALLCVGAGLNIAAARRDAGVIGFTSALKVLALPALTWVACEALGVDGLGQAVAVLYAALPGSGTSYVMARQMGGDAELMAGTITATTLISALVLPLILLSFGTL